MYLSHFGLNEPPFGITPNPAFFYTGNKRGEILEALIYAITHGEGIIKVTGEVGSGKTMLCRMLEDLLPKNVEAIYLVNPTLGREEVVYAIAGELGLATGGKRPDEVIRMLQSELIAKHMAGRQVVLLIEEAQAMPLETLEEIRLFSNLETAHHKLLQIVLFGQPELNDNLSVPRMRQLKERITHNFDVPPLEPKIIPDYLMFRMRAAGYKGPDIFSRPAVKQIASVSEGIVRRISILADKALLAAFADNTHAIKAKHVKAAIEDSEFAATVRARRRRGLLAGLGLVGAMAASAALTWHFSRQTPATAPPPPPAKAVAADSVAAAAPVATSAPGANASATASAAAVPPPSKPESATTAGLLQSRLDSTKAWLETEKPSQYTVQIILLKNDDWAQAEQVLREREAELGEGTVRIFPTRIGGPARFALLYGSFATRPEAVAIRSKLEKKPDYRPQLRTVEGIREEIGRTQSGDGWHK